MISKEASIHLIMSIIFNQSCKSDVAFRAPQELLIRLEKQSFDLYDLEHGGCVILHNAISAKPCLHRYHVDMSKYIYKSIQIINEKYESDPRNIWAKKCDMEVLNELKSLSGIGYHKAVQCLLYLNILGEIDYVSPEYFDYMSVKCFGFFENIDNDLKYIRQLI